MLINVDNDNNENVSENIPEDDNDLANYELLSSSLDRSESINNEYNLTEIEPYGQDEPESEKDRIDEKDYEGASLDDAYNDMKHPQHVEWPNDAIF